MEGLKEKGGTTAEVIKESAYERAKKLMSEFLHKHFDNKPQENIYLNRSVATFVSPLLAPLTHAEREDALEGILNAMRQYSEDRKIIRESHDRAVGVFLRQVVVAAFRSLDLARRETGNDPADVSDLVRDEVAGVQDAGNNRLDAGSTHTSDADRLDAGSTHTSDADRLDAGSTHTSDADRSDAR